MYGTVCKMLPTKTIHRDLAGHHPRPRGQPRQPRLRSQLGHRDHQVQRGPHGPLRVPPSRAGRPGYGSRELLVALVLVVVVQSGG